MKEKFDLSLDNRQIVSLLIAGLVVLGAVFVLGVVVGKKLATNQQTAAAPDLLTALDQNAAKVEEVRKDASLTFQDELTKKAPELPREEPKVVVAEKKPEPAPQPKVEVKPEPEQLAKVEEPVVAPEPKQDVKAQETPKLAEAPVKSDEIPTRTHDGGLKDAFAAAAKKTASPPTEVAPGGKFTLQLSATQTKEEAVRFAAKLKDQGYAPFIVEAQVPGRGTWYRVRMGSFPSKEAAAKYLQDFKRETNLEAFVAGN